MNEGLFQMTAVVLWLAAWSIAAVLRIGAADVTGQTRRIDGRHVWQTGWSSVRGTGDHDPIDIAWGGAALTAAWLAVVALPGGPLRPAAIPGLSISGMSPAAPFLGLLLLSDWLSRQSRRSDGTTTIPWQGWCALAANSAPAAWSGLFETADVPALTIGFWMPAAAAVWLLACTADLHSSETEPGLSRLAGVLRRWLLVALGIVVFWGGGELPGVVSGTPPVASLVILAKLVTLEILLALAVRRWLPTVPSAGVWPVAVATGLAGGALTAALIDGFGKDLLLIVLLQSVLLVCGILAARKIVDWNSPQPAGDSRPAVG